MQEHPGEAAGIAADWRARAVVFCGIAGLIVGGPASVQVFGGPAGPWSRPWRMYSRVGIERCVVRYTDGEQTLDRAVLLGLTEPVVRNRMGLDGLPAVREEAKRICARAADDQRSSLRVTADCSNPSAGFERVLDHEVACP